MPNRRSGSNRKRPKRRVGPLVAYLEKYVSLSSGLSGFGRTWVVEWLIETPRNRNHMIPLNSPVTLIEGLKMLFEYPYRAILDVVAEKTGEDLRLVVAVGDKEKTQILVIVEGSTEVILTDHKHAHDFRFPDVKALEAWMGERADHIKRLVEAEG